MKHITIPSWYQSVHRNGSFKISYLDVVYSSHALLHFCTNGAVPKSTLNVVWVIEFWLVSIVHAAFKNGLINDLVQMSNPYVASITTNYSNHIKLAANRLTISLFRGWKHEQLHFWIAIGIRTHWRSESHACELLFWQNTKEAPSKSVIHYNEFMNLWRTKILFNQTTKKWNENLLYYLSNIKYTINWNQINNSDKKKIGRKIGFLNYRKRSLDGVKTNVSIQVIDILDSRMVHNCRN